MGHEKVARLPFCTCPSDFSLALVCVLRRVFEQLVNSRAVAISRYNRCNIVILMVSSAWLMVSFSSCIACWFYWSISITTLHRVYLNMIRRAQLCIDAGGNHFQHLLWQYILSAFGYCTNFYIYAMLQTLANFSWPTLYYTYSCNITPTLHVALCRTLCEE